MHRPGDRCRCGSRTGPQKLLSTGFPYHLISYPPAAVQNVLNPHHDSHKTPSPTDAPRRRRRHGEMSRRLTAGIQRKSQPPVQSTCVQKWPLLYFGCSHSSQLPPLVQVMLACKHVSKATRRLCIGCACGALPACTSYGCRNEGGCSAERAEESCCEGGVGSYKRTLVFIWGM